MPPQLCQASTRGSLPWALTSLPPPGVPIPAGLTCAPGSGLALKPGHPAPCRAGREAPGPAVILCPSNCHNFHLITAAGTIKCTTGCQAVHLRSPGQSSELPALPTLTLPASTRLPALLATPSPSRDDHSAGSPPESAGPRTQPFFASSS